mgnify:CR=1 FL=1
MIITKYNSDTIQGHEVYRINNDLNGNGRWVMHYLSFDDDYDKALKVAKEFGGKAYKAKWFGGGFVFTMYKTEIKSMIDIIDGIKSGYRALLRQKLSKLK